MTTENRLLSIDVECVATGFGHDARSPCSVAIVNDRCEILFQSLIKPTDNVISDLFPLSGVRIKDLENAPILDDVLKQVTKQSNSSCLSKRHFFFFLSTGSSTFESIDDYHWSKTRK